MSAPRFETAGAAAAPYLRSLTREVFMRSAQDALDALGEDYFLHSRRFTFHESNFAPEFYDLKTGLAGEIFQKFSNYQVQAVILGDFARVASPRFREFMLECNRGRQFRFCPESRESEAWSELIRL